MKFAKLMKNELSKEKPRKTSYFSWVLDEQKYLKLSDVKKLRNACQKAKNLNLNQCRSTSIRDWFMVELGLFTGLRVKEMAELNCGDLLIKNGQSSLIVRHGKGNRKRVVILNNEFRKKCLWFLKYKEKINQNISEDAPLLCSPSGTRLSKRALQKAFKRCLKKAKLPQHYSIHCLRHTYGAHLYKASNHNLRLVQQQLGHASITTTEVYANLMATDVKEAVENLYK